MTSRISGCDTPRIQKHQITCICTAKAAAYSVSLTQQSDTMTVWRPWRHLRLASTSGKRLVVVMSTISRCSCARGGGWRVVLPSHVDSCQRRLVLSNGWRLPS